MIDSFLTLCLTADRKKKFKDFFTKKRIEDIEELDSETRSKLFFLIDNVIQNFKTKKAFS